MMATAWLAVTQAEKRRARRLEARKLARIIEIPANYIGKRGLVVTRDLMVIETEKRTSSHEQDGGRMNLDSIGEQS